jgi:hypothetical protein
MDSDIRELARAAGHTEDLTTEQVQEIERRIQADHVDKILDGDRK